MSAISAYRPSRRDYAKAATGVTESGAGLICSRSLGDASDFPLHGPFTERGLLVTLTATNLGV